MSSGMIINECQNGLQWIQIIDGKDQPKFKVRKYRWRKDVNWFRGKSVVSPSIRNRMKQFALTGKVQKINRGKIREIELRYNNNLLLFP